MTVDPAVSEAADNYTGLPSNFGTDTNLIRISERDAFIAGVEWERGHATNGNTR